MKGFLELIGLNDFQLDQRVARKLHFCLCRFKNSRKATHAERSAAIHRLRLAGGRGREQQLPFVSARVGRQISRATEEPRPQFDLPGTLRRALSVLCRGLLLGYQKMEMQSVVAAFSRQTVFIPTATESAKVSLI